MDLQGVLEGMLFIVGEEGLTLKQISEFLEIDNDKAKELLLELKKSYENSNRGIRISYLADTFKLTTKKEYKDYYQKLVMNPETNTLSQAALETLAIIAYKQPITRVEIDDLRGVGTSHIIRKLLAKELIKAVGKSTLPGHPTLYGTTSDFLDYFGLASINDLPEFNPEEKETSEKELFTSIYKDNDEKESV